MSRDFRFLFHRINPSKARKIINKRDIVSESLMWCDKTCDCQTSEQINFKGETRLCSTNSKKEVYVTWPIDKSYNYSQI